MKKNNQNSFTAWVVCLVASLFFFYEFIQMNMLNTISSHLLHDLHITATQLSVMSSTYFIANVLFLFVAGILLDRFSVKKVILIALAVCIMGTALFASANNLYSATFYRFLTGIGAAFCFLSVIRLATRWFTPSHLALVIGLVVTIAMLGGVVAQKPLAVLVKLVGWRLAIGIDAMFGLVIFALIALIVKECPEDFEAQRYAEIKQVSELGYWRSMRLAFSKMQNWLGGIYSCLMNLPVIILGGLWGEIYLEKVQGISSTLAPEITQMLFFGTIIGSPLIGWVSDRARLRRPPMLYGAIVSVLILVALVGSIKLPPLSLSFLFFFIGLMTSSQVLSYSVVAESALPAITAVSVSVVNITVQGGLAIFEPTFGYLMDLHHRIIIDHTGIDYVKSDFDWAMMIFPIGVVLASFAAIAMDETHCRRVHKKIGN